MEENVRKVSKVRLLTYTDGAVKRGTAHRFAKWCSEKYNISWRGVYESFRGSNTSEWKKEGMFHCVQEFDPEYGGTLKEFWKNVQKNRFADFMNQKGICRNTLWKKFTADDWTELELKGIKAMYQYWLENVELKK